MQSSNRARNKTMPSPSFTRAKLDDGAPLSASGATAVPMIALRLAKQENVVLARNNAQLMLRCRALEAQCRDDRRPSCGAQQPEEEICADALTEEDSGDDGPLASAPAPAPRAVRHGGVREAVCHHDASTHANANPRAPPEPPSSEATSALSPHSLQALSNGMHQLTLHLLLFAAELLPSTSTELLDTMVGSGGAPTGPNRIAVTNTGRGLSEGERDVLARFAEQASVMQRLEAVVRTKVSALEAVVSEQEKDWHAHLEVCRAHDDAVQASEAQSTLHLRQFDEVQQALAETTDLLMRARSETAAVTGQLREAQSALAAAQTREVQLLSSLRGYEVRNEALEETLAKLQLNLMTGNSGPSIDLAQDQFNTSISEEDREMRTQWLVKALRSSSSGTDHHHRHDTAWTGNRWDPASALLPLSPQPRTPPAPSLPTEATPSDMRRPTSPHRRVLPSSLPALQRASSLAREMFARAMDDAANEKGQRRSDTSRHLSSAVAS